MSNPTKHNQAAAIIAAHPRRKVPLLCRCWPPRKWEASSLTPLNPPLNGAQVEGGKTGRGTTLRRQIPTLALDLLLQQMPWLPGLK
ncbi:hypothetical protein PIB30_034149 [Stylosanthes scabra]|uniref:Uncharacterized protein n=1 Tax=Stylosanthes scabra TaxID=79078 RepID=A0ABU6VCT1_9FABA|nr:hypothetical protein [Stylosanthes scabra]